MTFLKVTPWYLKTDLGPHVMLSGKVARSLDLALTGTGLLCMARWKVPFPLLSLPQVVVIPALKLTVLFTLTRPCKPPHTLMKHTSVLFASLPKVLLSRLPARPTCHHCGPHTHAPCQSTLAPQARRAFLCSSVFAHGGLFQAHTAS